MFSQLHFLRPPDSTLKCLLSSAAMASTPPPLMKKHSQTDLVSRLKSRKVLGVGGEDDDGEVHRSKLFGLSFELCSLSLDYEHKAIIVKPPSISLILWNGLYTAEKVIIQWTLLTEACYFGVQFLVTSITLLDMGTLSNGAIVLLLSETFFLFITLSYYHHLGRRTKKI
ncbi:tumor protein p53-inducible protein 11-like [Sinocyclocheilus rhinocerous]|uniref:tumor protein p53-inducible protein 11-like n=1 Tax=Sinocyclocheilus rhinocerous TaxID=307959 RepID=UPI0007B917E7|nr:PREDICTED: tumor protein p53-inducible protein 11-like [Sinocyclocheilus rhinocerous]